jgi:hypothetical protein
MEMQIAFKETLDHLRSALDYCAHEVCVACGTTVASPRLYFPIVARGFAQADFRSRVGQLMPGVLQARPDLEAILASFQPFASSSNGWLADLATLANDTKHDHLSVAEVAAAHVKLTRRQDGTFLADMRKPDDQPFTRPPLMLIEDFPENGVGEAHYYYIRLARIDEELLHFLKAAISGVKEIITRLEAAL